MTRQGDLDQTYKAELSWPSPVPCFSEEHLCQIPQQSSTRARSSPSSFLGKLELVVDCHAALIPRSHSISGHFLGLVMPITPATGPGKIITYPTQVVFTILKDRIKRASHAWPPKLTATRQDPIRIKLPENGPVQTRGCLLRMSKEKLICSGFNLETAGP